MTWVGSKRKAEQEHHPDEDEGDDADAPSAPAEDAVPPRASQHPAPKPSTSDLLLLEVSKRLEKLDAAKDDNGEIPTRKELDTVKVPSYPSIATYRDWTTQLTRNVNTAANRFDDDSIAWLRSTFEVNITFEQFYECPKEFLTLDRKLAKSLKVPRFLFCTESLTRKLLTI